MILQLEQVQFMKATLQGEYIFKNKSPILKLIINKNIP